MQCKSIGGGWWSKCSTSVAGRHSNRRGVFGECDFCALYFNFSLSLSLSVSLTPQVRPCDEQVVLRERDLRRLPASPSAHSHFFFLFFFVARKAARSFTQPLSRARARCFKREKFPRDTQVGGSDGPCVATTPLMIKTNPSLTDPPAQHSLESRRMICPRHLASPGFTKYARSATTSTHSSSTIRIDDSNLSLSLVHLCGPCIQNSKR